MEAAQDLTKQILIGLSILCMRRVKQNHDFSETMSLYAFVNI